MWLFRWYYDTMSEVVYTEKEAVMSEEGIFVIPQKTCEEFRIEDYDCLILPGCSDTRQAIQNKKLKSFLERFSGIKDFIIGAICCFFFL